MGIADDACECCTCCVCCIASPILCFLVGLIVTIGVALGIAALVLYFLLVPKAPEVDLVISQLHGFNLSTVSGTPTISELQGGLSLTLEIRNPNRVSLKYGNSSAVLFYATLALDNNTIEAFSQNGKSTVNKTTDMAFQTPIPTTLQSSFSSSYQNGTVPLKLEVNLQGKIEIWGVSSPKAEVTLECDIDIGVFMQQVTSHKCSRTRSYVT